MSNFQKNISKLMMNFREVQFSFTSWVNDKSSFQPTIEGTYGYSSFQNGRLLVKAGLVLIGEEQTLANLTVTGEKDSSYFLAVNKMKLKWTKFTSRQLMI